MMETEITIATNETIDPLYIGIKGTNSAYAINFDFSAWADEYGTGTLALYCKDSDLREVTLETSGTIARWEITGSDTTAVGKFQGQLVYTAGEAVIKSNVFSVYVSADINSFSGG